MPAPCTARRSAARRLFRSRHHTVHACRVSIALYSAISSYISYLFLHPYVLSPPSDPAHETIEPPRPIGCTQFCLVGYHHVISPLSRLHCICAQIDVSTRGGRSASSTVFGDANRRVRPVRGRKQQAFPETGGLYCVGLRSLESSATNKECFLAYSIPFPVCLLSPLIKTTRGVITGRPTSFSSSSAVGKSQLNLL